MKIAVVYDAVANWAGLPRHRCLPCRDPLGEKGTDRSHLLLLTGETLSVAASWQRRLQHRHRSRLGDRRRTRSAARARASRTARGERSKPRGASARLADRLGGLDGRLHRGTCEAQHRLFHRNGGRTAKSRRQSSTPKGSRGVWPVKALEPGSTSVVDAHQDHRVEINPRSRRAG